jgi:hypothetical protein
VPVAVPVGKPGVLDGRRTAFAIRVYVVRFGILNSENLIMADSTGWVCLEKLLFDLLAKMRKSEIKGRKHPWQKEGFPFVMT